MRSAGRTTGERTADSCSRKAMNALESGPFCSLVRSGFLTGKSTKPAPILTPPLPLPFNPCPLLIHPISPFPRLHPATSKICSNSLASNFNTVLITRNKGSFCSGLPFASCTYCTTRFFIRGSSTRFSFCESSSFMSLLWFIWRFSYSRCCSAIIWFRRPIFFVLVFELAVEAVGGLHAFLDRVDFLF